MISDAIQKLKYQIDTLPNTVKAISEEKISFRPQSRKWSKKEILGHLIDSACNNHTRFIKASIEEEMLKVVPYEQNKWVELSNYQHTPLAEIINLWFAFNKHILNLISLIPVNKLNHPCELLGGKIVSLGWLINDYVNHLEHHINQITNTD